MSDYYLSSSFHTKDITLSDSTSCSSSPNQLKLVVDVVDIPGGVDATAEVDIIAEVDVLPPLGGWSCD